VWFHFVGFHPVVLWQVTQLVAPLGMCVVFLPLAELPLWQPVQSVAALKLAWSTLAPLHDVLDLWQVSQTVCPAWIVVLGLALAWQVAHCVVRFTPACSFAGVQAVYPALWQVSQLAEAAAATSWYGVWFADLPSAGGKAPVWQLVHCAVTGTCVWFHFVGFQPAVLWQVTQLVAPLGMCVEFFPLAALPLWHPVQSVAALKLAWSTLAPLHDVLDLWQFSQTVCPAWIVVLGLALAWQVAHCVVTATLACSLAGFHDVNPALWQVSQLADAAAATWV
jgi:hypothetical protein